MLANFQAPEGLGWLSIARARGKMKRNSWLLLSFMMVFCFSSYSAAQWSGILQPTSGNGACSFGQITSAGQCAIDWTQVGLPGGVPTNWIQSGSTIAASACGNGASDCTSTIQAALNSCGGASLPGKYVLLGSGTFLILGNLHIKNYCYLAGGGPQATVLLGENTNGAPVVMGSINDDPYKNGTCTITSGATAGSTSIALSTKGLDSNPCAVGVGGYLVISELSDPVYVSGPAPQNPGGCGYCDVIWGGTRLREQIVEMESVSGSGPYTVTISPALYTNYGVASGTSPAYATPFGALNGGKPDCKYCGVENLQVESTGTALAAGTDEINMTECAYCFVKNVEVNYTDGNWVDAAYCYRCEIRDSYFFDSYGHGAGGTDNYVGLGQETSASLVENNIMERGHVSIEVDLGAAGNVIAYNYSTGAVDAVGTNVNELDMNNHGAFPQFNLWEGNTGPNFQPDSWHGNEGYNTAFRNWWRGSTLIATYPQQPISSIACSSGTCTITWVSGTSQFYAGTYISVFGTNQPACGSGTLSTPVSGVVWQLTGSHGSLSSTFSGNCAASATGGFAFTNDLQNYPTPITHTGAGALSWTSTYLTYQGMWGITVPAFSVGNNLVGNVLGSDQQTATVGGKLYNGGSAPCTSCGRAATSRPYSGEGFMSTFGYDTSGDSNGSTWTSFPGGPSNMPGYWVGVGFATTFYHGNYDSASASTVWNVNGIGGETLPASFYKSSQPAFWSTAYGAPPWPAIGPDVSGGPDTATGGHANYIPAELCYNGLARDTTGAKLFDANTCFYLNPPPAPPTGLSAVIQ
jgi:hypothetical protein